MSRYIQQGGLGLRHWCEQGDDLQQFGWNKHDGKLVIISAQNFAQTKKIRYTQKTLLR